MGSPDALLADLTDAQRQAVLHGEGPLLILAGAGSGKTRVITRRAAHLVRQGARPGQVLAITFTNKAAGEMADRMAQLGDHDGMWVCTFHAFCARVLRRWAAEVGLTPDFTIFDEADRRSLLREALRRCQLNPENWRPQEVEADISAAKNRLVLPEAYERDAANFSDKTIARVYHEYQRLLASQNGCDFDDLLLHVAVLLEQRDDVREEIASRFRYLLIDEYQDTNRAQYVIAQRLAEVHRNLCATGDPDQSIYAWRGADIRNILDFEHDYPDATVIRLEQNFRSTGAILSAASQLIAHNARRKHKTLWTDGPRGEPVRVWRCEDGLDEARRIAEDIAAHVEAGGSRDDVAVFYRTNEQTRSLEEALLGAGVPYQVARGAEFYARKEIRDPLAYLRLIVNPADETALLRAIASPPRGIGKVTLDRLRATAEAGGRTLCDEIMAASTGKFASFGALLRALRALPTAPVAPLVEAVLTRSGLRERLEASTDPDESPLANQDELVSAARQFDDAHPGGSLADWLAQVSLVSDVDRLDDGGGRVTLMTLHSAKGLEFDHVYITGLEEDLLPHHRSVKADDREEIESERRLCFVGMTRARQRLTLTLARLRMMRGATVRTRESPFLRELPAEEIEAHDFGSQRDRSTAHLGRANADESQAPPDGLQPGQPVRHADYGEGRVLALEPRAGTVYIRVRFKDHGERAFALEHAPLYIPEP